MLIGRTYKSLGAQLLLGAAVATTSLYAPMASAQATAQQVNTLLGQGKWTESIAAADVYLKSAPMDMDIRFKRALMLVSVGRVAEAIPAYEGMVKDFPQQPEFRNNLAVLYLYTAQRERSLETADAMAKVFPDYALGRKNQTEIRRIVEKGLENNFQVNLAMQLEPRAGKSAPAPAPVQQAAGLPLDGVKDTLNAWANAWQGKNLDGYFGAYASDFQPEGGIGQAEWKKQRSGRITSKNKISVQMSDVKVAQEGSQAVATFVQQYTADNYADKTQKRLTFKQEQGRWRISSEKTL